MTLPPDPVVVAVVLTRNRRDQVLETLGAIAGQTRPPARIVVVDNASTDGTPDAIEQAFPDVELVRSAINNGPAAGRSLGLEVAFADEAVEAVWLVDDDTVPSPESLARTLEVAARVPRIGLLGQKGGRVVRGRIRHGLDGPPIAPDVWFVDFVLTDGALLTRDAWARAGGLDERFVIMMEDLEYALRVQHSGFVVARAELGIDYRHLGATSGSDATGSAAGPPWRLYYQTRNHLRWALDDGSLPEVLGWARRQVGGLIALPKLPDRRARLRARARGTWDALRGHLGESERFPLPR